MQLIKTRLYLFCIMGLGLLTLCNTGTEKLKVRAIDGMEMIRISRGSFLMGSSDVELLTAMEACKNQYPENSGCSIALYSKQEQPRHSVTVDAYWIDKTEVTNAQFCKFLNENGNRSTDGIKWFEPGAGHRKIVYGFIEEIDGHFKPQKGYEHFPAIEVSWYGAEAYCKWVGGRLPTEAEWEYAAKGPENFTYPWGNSFNGENLNYRDASFDFDNQGKDTLFNDGNAQWTEVGSYPQGASWCGVLDLSGNVHEWVSDWFSTDYYRNSAEINPGGPPKGTFKVVKGGSWYDPSWHTRASYRKGLSLSSSRMHWVGFRCVIPAT